MQILNVVEIINGNLSSIESYPITDTGFHEQIQKAEQQFLKKAKENNFIDDDDELLDDSYYSDNNGYEVMLTWSDVIGSIEKVEIFKNGGRGYYTTDGQEFYSGGE